MKPIRPSKSNKEFEKVAVDEWITGEVVDIGERVNDEKKVKDKETGEYKTVTAEEVRLVFTFDGYQYKHFSRWMTRSMNKESNLFKKYLKKLCPQLEPEHGIDIDKLKGCKVKVMWENNEWNGEIYQNVSQIRPITEVQVEEIVLSEAEHVF